MISFQYFTIDTYFRYRLIAFSAYKLSQNFASHIDCTSHFIRNTRIISNNINTLRPLIAIDACSFRLGDGHFDIWLSRSRSFAEQHYDDFIGMISSRHYINIIIGRRWDTLYEPILSLLHFHFLISLSLYFYFHFSPRTLYHDEVSSFTIRRLITFWMHAIEIHIIFRFVEVEGEFINTDMPRHSHQPLSAESLYWFLDATASGRTLSLIDKAIS
jgi:hypothetical protein